MQVDFMIIGAQKCGTSTLFRILKSHPFLVGSRRKETNFFSLSTDWRKGLPEYERLFEPKEGALYFEASPTYTFYPGGHFSDVLEEKYPIRNYRVWADIFDYNPKMKFIYLVRNPRDRIVSSYMHHYERGFIDMGIDDAIRRDRGFIDVSRYYTQISPYIRTFGAENVLIVDFEDLVRSRDAVLQKISKFLAIDFEAFSNYQEVHSNRSIGRTKRHHKLDNPSLLQRAIRKFLPTLWKKLKDNSKRSFGSKPTLTPESEEMIINMLELDVRELQGLMKKDLGAWMSLENLAPEKSE
jgi:hypothetical protein